MNKIKLTCFLFIMALCMSSMAKASIGDVIGEAEYSDIGAYINHYPIASYAVNGCTAVVCEDLENYGFDVIWNEETRTLTISRSTATQITGGSGVYKSSLPIGTKFADVLSTDIKVIANGAQIPSYSISGYTMVAIEDLASFGSFNWLDDLRAAKLWIDGLPVRSFVPLQKRQEVIYKQNEYDWSIFEYADLWYDLNDDGVLDPIKIHNSSVDFEDYGTKQVTNITMGGAEFTINEEYAYNVCSVIVCDIVPNDGAKELFIEYLSDNDWTFYDILKYSKGTISPVTVDNLYDDDISDYLGIGQSGDNYFNVNDDNTLTISQRTDSMGMWSVYVSYKYENNILKKQTQDYYPIAPGFISNRLKWSTYSDLIRYDDIYSWDEYLMLGEDYALAHESYWNYSERFNSNRPKISLNKGDYFKLLYDDGNDWVYIVKTDGTSGWIDLSYNYNYYDDGNNRWDVSQIAFYMAG